jgi:hypothetical protein
MKRKFSTITEKQITSEILIRTKQSIIYSPQKRLKMEEQQIVPKNLNKLSASQKGDWLEKETKKQLEKHGFSVTVTQSQYWEKDETNPKGFKKVIIGDNGIDGIARIRIEEKNYNCIIQCKCYAPTSSISTNVIAQLDNNIDHWKQERSFGLLVVLSKESVNGRAINAIKNARNPIIMIEITEIEDLKQIVQQINWDNYPGKRLKRTRIELGEADELENIGEVSIKGKKIKGLFFQEDLIKV